MTKLHRQLLDTTKFIASYMEMSYYIEDLKRGQQ